LHLISIFANLTTIYSHFAVSKYYFYITRNLTGSRLYNVEPPAAVLSAGIQPRQGNKFSE